MRTSTLTTYALCAAGALAQTPPGTTPFTNTNLGVRYGTTNVIPNILLSETLVATKPALYSNISYPLTYMVLLIDLSIPYSDLNSTTDLVPGLQPNHTTRLHWWDINVTQLPNGTFSLPLTSGSTTNTPAVYGGPMPGAGDAAHTYTLYMLPQPSNWSHPAAVKQGLYNPITVSARMNFSIEALVDVVGAPLAANYFRVQNTSSSSSSGTTTTTTAGVNATAATTGSSNVSASTATATSTIYTGAAGRILAANAALFAVGIMMFVWL